jgi:hypothetical protein
VQQRIFGQSPLKYPQNKRDVVDTYFVLKLMIRTDGWKTTVLMRQLLVKAQNEVTYGYLNQTFREMR